MSTAIFAWFLVSYLSKPPEDDEGKRSIVEQNSWHFQDLSSLRRLLQDMRNNAAAVGEAQRNPPLAWVLRVFLVIIRPVTGIVTPLMTSRGPPWILPRNLTCWICLKGDFFSRILTMGWTSPWPIFWGKIWMEVKRLLVGVGFPFFHGKTPGVFR